MQTEVAGMVERFKAEAGKAGALVYETSSAEDACNYILRLARERDVKSAVKSKSKLADEIKLRKHLESRGIDVKETDLREWMAQLVGRKPAERITMAQLGKLMSKATGEKLDSEPRALLNAASRAIRQYCIDADMGISEADLAIAETGTLVIAGNEGVTRLVAVLPRIHITLVNYRNVVELLEDVYVRLKSPKRDGSVKLVPGYVTYITGRNTTADIPGAVLARAQGPSEEHIVLVRRTSRRNVA